MSIVRIHGVLKVKAEQVDEFREIAGEISGLVQANETGTLFWQSYYRPESEEMVMHEAYENSEALLAHLDNVGHLLPRFGEVGEMQGPLEICGEPSDALREALAGWEPKYFST